MYYMILRRHRIHAILKRQQHVPNLVCVQQFCSQCEDNPDIDQDCPQCGKRKHSFWEDPVGDLLTYLCKTRSWANRVIAIAHNAKAFDLQFILSRAIFLKWRPELIMNGIKNNVYENGTSYFSGISHSFHYFCANCQKHLV
jgi:hypothetical protein